jgi:hypothetical protein
MTESFDFYPGDQVIRESYSVASIDCRYLSGISVNCRRGQEYWIAKSKLVFDIIVEEMS